jgi:hypothetical protein
MLPGNSEDPASILTAILCVAVIPFAVFALPGPAAFAAILSPQWFFAVAAVCLLNNRAAGSSAKPQRTLVLVRPPRPPPLS